jgi:mannose-6-phosphate isomerase-like protein (cupin superfamily)
MLIRQLIDCQEFIAGDGSILRELISAGKGNFAFNYSLAHAVVKPGQETKPHQLCSSELYFILEGEGEMHIDDESSHVHAGCTVYIPPNSKQFIKNIGRIDLKFLCIVEPFWRKEDEEVKDDR